MRRLPTRLVMTLVPITVLGLKRRDNARGDVSSVITTKAPTPGSEQYSRGATKDTGPHHRLEYRHWKKKEF